MGIFGPGVGGGLLAAAGAVKGVGEGITEAGQQQAKTDLETKMNDLAQKREEAITRLQGSQEAARQQTGIEAQNKNVQQEIAGRAGVAAAGRAAAETQLGEKLKSEEKRTERTATSRENVARIRATTAGAGKTPPKEWTPRSVTLQGSLGKDETGKTVMVPGRQMSIMAHRDGSQWVQVGDKLLPYDASKPEGYTIPGGGTDLAGLRRAPAQEIQKLLQNPLGTTPSGMPVKDSFVQRNGYLPSSYMQVAQAARDKAAPAGGGGGTGAPAPEPAEQETDEPDSSATTQPPPME